MIKANELRIGNLVYQYRYEKAQKENTISQIRRTKVFFINGASECFKDIDPIPLTEEWLLRFGFNSKYKSVHTHWNIKSFGIEQASDEDENGNSIPVRQEFYYAFTIEIKYVHQLQNLYFALTGEELTLKN